MPHQCFSCLVNILPPKSAQLAQTIFLFQFSGHMLKLHVIRNIFHTFVLEKKRMNIFFGEKCLKIVSRSGLPPPKTSSIETKMSKIESSLRCQSTGMLGYVFHHTVLKKRRMNSP